MQINILWTGREYYSLENCLVTIDSSGAHIQSTIVGLYEGNIYKVSYSLKTNEHWQTRSLEINSQQNNKSEHILLDGDGTGNWLYNGKPAEQFSGCTDVDIPLTPFTNTLPIRRLALKDNESQNIQVIYCDILGEKVTPVRQKYTRISDTAYHYENIPNDFEATIQVDEFGLVIDYPELFVRTAALMTNY